MRYPRKPSYVAPAIDHDREGDLLITYGGARPHHVIDFFVSSPNPSVHKNCDKQTGIAASVAYDKKINHYHKQYNIPTGVIVPYSVETYGMTHPRSQSFLNAFIKSSISSLDTKDWTAADKVTYSVKIRQARERLSVSLQMSNAEALLHIRTVTVRQLRLADLAHGAAAAGV